MKLCYKCKEKKNLESFGKNKRRRDGRKNLCKECRRKIDKERYIKKIKPQKITEREGYIEIEVISFKYGKFTVLLDEEIFSKLSFPRIYLAYCPSTKSFYAKIYRHGRKIQLHHLVLSCDKNHIIDHINHNTLDNRIQNLRKCSHSDNVKNRMKHNQKNTSRYKGVYLRKNAKKWEAIIYYDKKRLYLGCFDSEHDAARAYNRAALKYHGEFAYLNEILEEK